MDSQSNSRKRCTKKELIYCSQLIAVFVVVVIALFNLTFRDGDTDTCLWSSLISGSLGYLVPNPSVSRNESILPDIAIEQLDGVLPGEHGGSIHDETEQSDRTRG